MNKKTIKIAGWALGLSMAVAGIGASLNNSVRIETKATDLTYKLTIDSNDFNSTSYAANNNEKTSTAVCTTDNSLTMQVKWTSYQVMLNSSNMQWQKSKGYIYNSTDLGTITDVTVTSSAGTFTTYYGTSEQPASGAKGNNKGFFKTLVGSATGTSSKMEITFKVSTSTSYSVTYDENGATSGEVPTYEAEYEIGDSVDTLPNSGNLAKTGYTFTGWNTNANGGGTHYGAGVTGAFEITASTVLYAEWSINTHTVTYDANGGTGTLTDSSSPYDYGSDVTVKTNSFTYSNHTFVNWNTQADGEGMSYEPGAIFSITSNVTLYAQWIEGNFETVDYAFTSKSWAATSGGSSANWDSGKDGAQLSSGRGVQVTTDSSGANATSPVEYSHVSRVVVTYSTNKSSGAGSISVQIGSGTAKTFNVSTPTSDGTADRTAAFTFSPTETGKIKLTVNCTTNSIYIKSVSVTQRIITPTKATVEFAAGKGSYYNGNLSSTNTFSTADVIVKTYDDEDNLAKTYNQGTGFVLTVNGNELDATSEAQTLSLAGETAGNYNISVSVPDVGDNSEQDPAVSLTVVAKAPSSYEWTSPQTTVFYAHRDTFAIDGTLKLTFNDTAYTTTLQSAIRAYDDTKDNNAGSITEIPAHEDGTINVASETKYVLDMWQKDFPNGLHSYTEITVKVPTLTIEDNYAGNYYVGATRNMDVTVTATFGDEGSRTLDASEYILSQESVTPENTNPISVTATWEIDGESVATSNALVINPINSTRILNDLSIDALELSAGSNFVLSGNITLDVTENENRHDEALDQAMVTFTYKATGEPVTSSDRIKKSDAGTIVASYAEGSGAGKEVSCEFELSVTDAVVSEYTAPSYAANATKTTSISVGDIVYLVCPSATKELSGFSTTSTVYGLGASYSTNISKSYPLEIVEGANDGTYALEDSEGNYLNWSSGNSLTVVDSITSNSSWDIDFDNSGNLVITNAEDDGRRILWNSSSPRFAAYTGHTPSESGYEHVQLYKCAATPGVGDPVVYIKSVIDAYRLNSSSEGSICDADSSIYSTNNWSKAKAAFGALTSGQKSQLQAETDYFSAESCSYYDTFLMLLDREPAQGGGQGLMSFAKDGNSSEIMSTLAIVSAGIVTVGGFAFLRRKKEI